MEFRLFEPDENGVSFIRAYDPDEKGMLGFDENMHITRLSANAETAVRLISRLKEHALENGSDRISCDVTGETLDLCRKAGFTVFSSVVSANGNRSVRGECLLADAILGSLVHVVIEHRAGDLHEAFADEQYGCAAGYVEESLARGVFQNAYICGEDVPADTVSGYVIGIVYRSTGTSWWIVSQDRNYEKEEIISQIAFQEQYFETRIAWLQQP